MKKSLDDKNRDKVTKNISMKAGYQNVRQNKSNSTFNGLEYQKPKSQRSRLQGSRGTISPELARVVERAQAARQIPNQKEDTDCCWKPDKRRLTLNIQSPYFSSKETMV